MSCSHDSRPASERRSVDSPCAEGCESNIWPRLIVGLEPPATEDVRMRMRDSKGVFYDGNPGCPEARGIICTRSFFTSPSDRSVTLRIEPGTGSPAEAEIPLGAFNYCGREIAYVVVKLIPGRRPEIARPRLISPCETSPRGSPGGEKASG